MFLHLLMVTNVKGRQYCYHAIASDQRDLTNKHDQLLSQLSDREAQTISFRVIKTDQQSFASVQAVDPYYQKAILVDSINDLVHMDRMVLTK